MWAAPESPRGISLGVAEDIDWLTPTWSGGRSQDQQDSSLPTTGDLGLLCWSEPE